MIPIRIASVHYLNAEPLTWGFAHGSGRDLVCLSRHAPSRIPALLASGAVDVGLIPSIEYQRVDGLEILPGLCVGSRHRARSVLLVTRRPLRSIRSIALDSNSRTSAGLLKVFLAHRKIHNVAFEEQAPSLQDMLIDHDAALIIGDPALTCDTTGLRVWDLGTEWFAITGFPFVFAVWAKRVATPLPQGIGPFIASYREGRAHLGRIARDMASPLGMPAEALEEYLSVDLNYDLGVEELRGLDLFFRQARELKLVPAHRPIRLLTPRVGHSRAARRASV